MGWTSNPLWHSTKQAIEEESKPNNDWQIVWHNGSSYIYTRKTDNYPAHSYFLSHKSKDGIWIKDISDFRTVAAAKKFKTLATAYMKANPNSTDIKSILERLKDCDAIVKNSVEKEKLKNLKVGDTAFVKDCYTYCGVCTIVELPNTQWNHRRSFICRFPNQSLVRVNPDAFDLEKTFNKDDEQKSA